MLRISRSLLRRVVRRSVPRSRRRSRRSNKSRNNSSRRRNRSLKAHNDLTALLGLRVTKELDTPLITQTIYLIIHQQHPRKPTAIPMVDLKYAITKRESRVHLSEVRYTVVCSGTDCAESRVLLVDGGIIFLTVLTECVLVTSGTDASATTCLCGGDPSHIDEEPYITSDDTVYV